MLIPSGKQEGVNLPVLKRKSVNKTISTYSVGILFFPQHVDPKDSSIHQTSISKRTGERVTTTAAALRALGQSQSPTNSTSMLTRAYETAPGVSFKRHIHFPYTIKHA